MDKEDIEKLEKIIEQYIESRLKLWPDKRVFSVDMVRSLLMMPQHIESKAVKSSNVASIGYHDKSQTLKVTFKGGAEYRYLAVSDKSKTLLEKSPSKGRAMTQVKIMHQVVKIEPGSFK